MVPRLLPPFVELVDCRRPDDGQREQGFGAMSSVNAVLRSRGGYFGSAVVRHRIGRRWGAERVTEEIGPLAAHIDEIVGVFSEFLAETLDAASPAFSGACQDVADPRGWFAGQAFDPDAVGGVMGDLYVFVLERDRLRQEVGSPLGPELRSHPDRRRR